MKKYVFMRILRSLVSIFLVTTLTYMIIYTLTPRNLIFKNDPNYNKVAKTKDSKINYENTVYDRMGYLEYMDSKSLQQKASKEDSSVTVDATTANEKIYKEYINKLGHGWQLKRFPESKSFYAVREIPVFERVVSFYANLIQFDHPGWVKDASNPNLKRYIRIENDPSIGWSVVGSGTKHKYLLYFNGQFPYVHQNFVTLNLGNSYPTYSNTPVLQVITQGQGTTKKSEVNFPTGKKTSSIDIDSRTYKSPSKADSQDISRFGKGDAYTATLSNYENPSMIASSSIIGLIGIAISYLKVPAFVATLATQSIGRGLTEIISGGVTIRVRDDSYTAIGNTSIGGISVIIIYAAVILVFTWFLLNRTRFGYYIYAIGGNKLAAQYSGVNVKKYNMLPYVLIGLFCGLSGLIWSARLGSAAATLGSGFEMDAIAAVVIGGTSMSGGVGTVGGTFIGVLIIGVITNGLNLMGINSFWQEVFKGIIILVAVVIDVVRKTKTKE